MARNKTNMEQLDAEDIKMLSKKRNGGKIYFSLYVGVKPGINFLSEANAAISECIHGIRKEKKYSRGDMKKIEKISANIKERIRLLKVPRETRSIAMFCEMGKDGKLYHIPAYIPSKFVVESDFYVHPFIKALENYPKYLVLVLERDKARFFDFFLGKIEEISQIIASDVPQRINAGRAEWKALRETRVQKHIIDHENRHLKKISAEAENYFKFGKKGYSYLVLGAHKELANKFSGFMGEKSRSKLIGSYFVTPKYRISEIKAKSHQIAEDFERKEEEKIADILLNASGKRENFAVLGLNFTLENYYLHNVKEFIIGRDYAQKGFLCLKCHYISSYEKICPIDKAGMVEVDDVVDEIIEEAIANKIKVKHFIYHNEKFDRFGIGAILRSRL